METSRLAGEAQARLDAERDARHPGLREDIEAVWRGGVVQGRVDALLALLEERKVTLTVEQTVRIERCTDKELLLRWIRRAAKARTAANVF